MFTIEEYIEAKRLGKPHTGVGRSPLTLKSYTDRLYRAEDLLDKNVNEINGLDPEVLLERMDEAGLMPASKNAILASLRGLFDWACATGRYKGPNPFSTLVSFKVDKFIPVILNKEEAEFLLTTIGETSRRYELFFRIMLYCGLRIGEVIKLRRTDVLSDALVVHGKGGKQRVVPLPPKLATELDQYIRKHSKGRLIFSNKDGEALTQHYPGKVFKEAVLKCNYNPELTPHNLRHTSATLFHELTGDLAMTQDYLGHASPETTRRYAQISQERMKKAHSQLWG